MVSKRLARRKWGRIYKKLRLKGYPKSMAYRIAVARTGLHPRYGWVGRKTRW